MFERPSKQITERITFLRAHLEKENPLLVDVVASFQELDGVAYRMGLLHSQESYATNIAWWPLVTVLGTFSAGKSTFVNHYLGKRIQLTGNQAVDDKFTVACFSDHPEARTLPGLALDADPRFPFYQISEEIEKVEAGEGGKVDTYLQLKTCPSPQLKGKILIDSPGFDADSQRTATLRITDYIIGLSDLVLVFFDARHPEPGAMQDTLEHLVAGTVRRHDSNKVLFILNQIDTTAREDNAEDVVAAWQRSLAQVGLVSGRFFTIYNQEAAVPIEDETLRRRYESKRDTDLSEIYHRIGQVSVERSYRIIGSLENVANQIEHRVVPELTDALKRWRRRVLIVDGVVLLPLFLVLLVWTIAEGYWQGFSFVPPWINLLGAPAVTLTIVVLVLLAVAGGIHFWARKLIAAGIARGLAGEHDAGRLDQAFRLSTRWWRTLFLKRPKGWGGSTRRRVAHARRAADHYVQTLNDRFTNPSGIGEKQDPVSADEPKTAAPQTSSESGDRAPTAR